MAAKDEIEFNNRYAELQKQIVIEITEEESIDYHALETKKNAPGFEGAFALDDYEVDTVTRRVFLIWHRSISK